VLDDADLDEAVAAAAFGAFMNQGQICMSTERLIVDESVADEFAAKARREGGDVGRRRSAQGPRAARRVGRLRRGRAGARPSARPPSPRVRGLIAGGAANGVLMDAAVLDYAHRRCAFTPKSPSGRCGDHSRRRRRGAVRVANDSEYGLAAAVFGRDCHSRAVGSHGGWRAASATSTDRPCMTRRRMPFGGVKASGYGRFGGAAAIHEFTELRWITIGTGQGRYPI